MPVGRILLRLAQDDHGWRGFPCVFPKMIMVGVGGS